MTAKILEFKYARTPYLAFVSLRERNLLEAFLKKHTIHYSADDSGEIVAIHFFMDGIRLKKLRDEFPNIHIVAGVL
jgi:hypothetical protein